MTVCVDPPYTFIPNIAETWRRNYNIRIHFLDGYDFQHKAVIQYSSMWGTNLQFGHIRKNSDVRISFRDYGRIWSYHGRDCLAISKKKPTMMLGFFKPNLTESVWMIQHAFGHMLGYPHVVDSASNHWGYYDCVDTGLEIMRPGFSEIT